MARCNVAKRFECCSQGLGFVHFCFEEPKAPQPAPNLPPYRGLVLAVVAAPNGFEDENYECPKP